MAFPTGTILSFAQPSLLFIVISARPISYSPPFLCQAFDMCH